MHRSDRRNIDAGKKPEGAGLATNILLTTAGQRLSTLASQPISCSSTEFGSASCMSMFNVGRLCGWLAVAEAGDENRACGSLKKVPMTRYAIPTWQET